jgi:putative ATP-dependent endonuclease of the OLD family
MKLKRLSIRNFRCFREQIDVNFEDLTALVGKNDSGKSSILEALDIFLNDGDPDKDDASRDGDPADLTIICEFGNLPSEIIIDDSAPTNLTTEYLLNPTGNLEVHKTYSGHLQKPKCIQTVLFAIHPNGPDIADLLQLKNSELKKRAEKLGLDLDGINPNVNAQLRGRIRQHVPSLVLEPTKISLDQDNGRKIWEGLKKHLPLYSLFKADRASSDQDAEAQDPLKIAIKEALKNREAELAQIAEYVKGEVQKIADSTLAKLCEMDSSLASQLKPTFTTLKWDSLFKASLTSDDDIPINKRGSGVKRLILLNFFRAKCEQLALETGRPNVIYAIEEPETSQHPNNKRMLLRALADLSSEAQVIVSTHTPVLAPQPP